jgi:hypothetical protein
VSAQDHPIAKLSPLSVGHRFAVANPGKRSIGQKRQRALEALSIGLRAVHRLTVSRRPEYTRLSDRLKRGYFVVQSRPFHFTTRDRDHGCLYAHSACALHQGFGREDVGSICLLAGFSKERSADEMLVRAPA